MKPLIASVGILSLFATCADAVTIRLDGHPTINQINMNQRPPWDSIPDIEFRCQNANPSSNDELKLVLSHNNKELYINDKPFSAISESNAGYMAEKNEFGNYEAMISITLVRGPGWEFSSFQSTTYFVLTSRPVFYSCV